MKPVVFILSPGRCGTHYVSDFLRLCNQDRVEVHHERLRFSFEPRKYFRRYDEWSIAQKKEIEEISEVVDSIRATTRNKSYIDTGWAVCPFLPFFIREFKDQIKLIFQIRHPFDASISHTIWHEEHRRLYKEDQLAEHCFLRPTDNAFHP